MALTTPRHGKRKASHVDNHKTCTSCGQTKTLDTFGKHNSRKDGLSSRCKPCNNSKARAYYFSDPEKARAKARKYQKENPGYYQARYKANIEQMVATNKAWVKSNPEKVLANAKAWRKSNPEKVALNTRNWRKKNPEKTATYSSLYRQANREKISLGRQIRRARKLNNGVFKVTAKEIKRLYALPCAYCGAPSKHIDHVIPLSRGGAHSIGNLVGACARCNMGKGSKFITEWN